MTNPSPSARVIETISIAADSIMRILQDDSKPATDIDHLWIENIWDPPSKDTPLLNVPLHWHQHHDEYLEVTDGAMNVYHYGKWHVLTPESGVVVAERGDVHSFYSFAGVKVTLKERVQPSGAYKVAFFKDLGVDGPPGFWRTARVAYDHDLYPSLSRWPWVDWVVITLVGGVAKLVQPAATKENAPKRW